jgi:hypothetical protein
MRSCSRPLAGTPATLRHPLASYKGAIPKSELEKHVQLVLTDRSTLSAGKGYGVFS